MELRVVARYADGSILKGVTRDFFPNKDTFHLIVQGSGATVEINTKVLKAVFFVKSFEGNPAYEEGTETERKGFGKKIRINFNDGESVTGYTQGFSGGREGFFVFPADPNSNNDRIFVITAATKEITFV